MSNFEKKKIQTEILSEYLSSARIGLKLSVKEVSDKTGIKRKFLEGLESGNFSVLPADVYIAGFLGQLARIYSVHAEDLVKQYKKEKNIQLQIAARSAADHLAWYKRCLQKLVLTPKILSFVLGLLFVCLTLAYIIWQVWSINRTPALRVLAPANNSVIAGGAVEVKGQTDSGMSVAINGESIFVDSEGNFHTQLGLTPGPKEITVVAKNRFDKSAGQTINITGAAVLKNAENHLELKINFTANVVLDISIDAGAPQALEFTTGDAKTFSAKTSILLSTSDAGATHVLLNGQNIGALGRSKERLENVQFLSQEQENE